MSGRLIDAEKLVRVLMAGPETDTSRFILKRINEGVFDAQSPTPGQDGQWIPVSERLPEPEKNFLSFGHYGYGLDMYSTNPFNSNQLPTLDKLRITHWMPLPPSPTSTGERE